MSVVEIIYFFTLRAWCMVYKDEKLLVEIDRKRREQPLEEFYLGLKLKKAKPTPNIERPNKLMIFDGRMKEIPQFVPNRPIPVRIIFNIH